MRGKIELINISKSYGDKKIINNFSLQVNKGDSIVINGHSGCGKSTLLNMIGLIEPFDEGDLIINGYENIKPNSKTACKLLRNELGYLFQNFALIDNEKVKSNLNIALKYVNETKKQKEYLVQDALDYVGLQGFENRYVFELSGGEQQRVAIARIMLKPCSIILADEPTGSLDEDNRNKVMDLLLSLNKKGKTLIIVTHDNYIVKQCDRVINLRKMKS